MAACGEGRSFSTRPDNFLGASARVLKNDRRNLKQQLNLLFRSSPKVGFAISNWGIRFS